MKMTEFDDDFFSENIVSINKKIQKILFFTCIVPVLFFAFTKLGVWDIEPVYSLGLFIYIFCCYAVEVWLNGNQNLRRFTMYYGLIVLCGVVFLLFANRKVNPSIALAIVPFLSCLYYDKKLTLTVNIVNIFFIGCAVFIRFSSPGVDAGTLEQADNSAAGVLPYAIGISMELFFLAFCTYLVSENAHKTYMQVLFLAQKRKDLFEQLQLRNNDLQSTQYKIIQFTGKCLGSHDFVTGRHVIHTQEFVELIATTLRKLGFYSAFLSNDEIETYSNAAFLHDIGKVYIPSELLNKKEPLTDKEVEIMKRHTAEGVKLLELLPQIDNGHFNEIAIQMAGSHHEAWDGSGYPKGLREREIPLCARILAVADSLDNFIFKSENPLNAVVEAMNFLESEAGKKYERCIVDTVIKLRPEIEVLVEQFISRESVSVREDMQWWIATHRQ